MKKIIAAVLFAALAAGLLCSCTPKLDVTGTWKGAWVYEGVAIDDTLTLAEDGTYEELIFRDGVLDSSESGVWESKNGQVITHLTDETASTIYDYDHDSGELINNEHRFQKS